MPNKVKDKIITSPFHKLLNVYSYLPELLVSFIPCFEIKNWREVWADSWGFKRSRYIIQLYNGLKYAVRGHTLDRLIIIETNLHRSYNPKGFKIGANSIILDVGAHVGSFSIYAAKLFKNNIVYALEPDKDNHKMLLKNLELNNLSNVHTFNVALGATSRIDKFYKSRNNTGGHSLFRWNSNYFESEKVKVISLQEFIREQRVSIIDFMKVDIEGGEYELIEEGDIDFLNKVKKIALEFHYIDKDRNGKKLKSYLETKGFDVRIKALPGATRGMLYARNLTMMD